MGRPMAEIQRWKLNRPYGSGAAHLEEDAAGNWVEYADYERDIATKDARFECLLRNAIKMASYREKRIRPLWGLVRDLTGYGSTTAKALCRSLGWNPDASARDRLPPPPAGESEKT